MTNTSRSRSCMPQISHMWVFTFVFALAAGDLDPPLRLPLVRPPRPLLEQAAPMLADPLAMIAERCSKFCSFGPKLAKAAAERTSHAGSWYQSYNSMLAKCPVFLCLAPAPASELDLGTRAACDAKREGHQQAQTGEDMLTREPRGFRKARQLKPNPCMSIRALEQKLPDNL